MRFYKTGPAHHRRYAIATLPVAVLLAAELRRATVRPCECLGAIVCRVDDDRIVGDPKIIEFLKELTHLAVMLYHAVRVDTETGLPLGLGFQSGPDMHAAWIEPREEWLILFLRSVDEVDRCFEKLLVHCLHSLFVEGARVFTILLAPFSKARVLPRGFG